MSRHAEPPQQSPSNIDGVLVEIHDALGNSVGQAVYWDWAQRPLPAVGDRITVAAIPLGTHAPTATYRRTPATVAMSGHVLSRHFDVQQDATGEPSIWVRLVVERHTAAAPTFAITQTVLAGHAALSSN